jgi:hypothetical protein
VLKIQARITHDFLDHVWNEALLQEKWVYIDSTLAYPVSLNHPYYYEQNWGKKYEYVLAFSENGGMEDVTKIYTVLENCFAEKRKRIIIHKIVTPFPFFY